MFRVHTSINRSIRCLVTAHGFLHRVFGWVVVLRAAAWIVCTVRMVLQLNIWCSWWWAYVPETCRAKNTLIKSSCCIKLAFHFILPKRHWLMKWPKVLWMKKIRDKWRYPAYMRSPLAIAVKIQLHTIKRIVSSICMTILLMLCMEVVLFSAVTLNVRDSGPLQSSTQIIKAVPLLDLYKANLYSRTNIFQWWANHDKCWVMEREGGGERREREIIRWNLK